MKHARLISFTVSLFLIALVPVTGYAWLHVFNEAHGPLTQMQYNYYSLEPAWSHNDTLMDVLAYRPDLDQPIYRLNQRDDGTFYSSIALEWEGEKYDLSTIDWNNDGDSDFVLACDSQLGPDVVVFVRDNQGYQLGPFVYDEGVHQVEAGDLDGDGDIDVAVDRGYWYNNQNGLFQQQPINDPFPNPRTVALIDMDRDDDLDLFMMVPDSMAVFENDGAGIFTRAMTFSEFGADEVVQADLDRNGYPDLVFGDDQVMWILYQTGASEWAQPVVHETTIDQYNYNYTHQLHAVDYDNDLDIDIIINLLWYENTPDGFVPKLENNMKLYSKLPYYSDRDNLIDFVGSQGEVYINHVNVQVQDGLFEAGYVTSFLYTGDLNGDGFDDLIGHDYNSDSLKIFLNVDGDLQIYESFHVYTSNDNEIWIIDYDGDGDTDILNKRRFNYTHPDSFYVYYNDGMGYFDYRFVYTSDYQFTRTVFEDIDGDGDIDFVSQVEEVGSNDPFWAIAYQETDEFTIDELPDYGITPSSYIPADMESDGDVDILCVYNTGSFYASQWLERNQDTYTLLPEITNAVHLDHTDYRVDLDADGYVDMIGGKTVHWGQSNHTFHVQGLSSPTEYGGLLGDFDRNGLYDMLYHDEGVFYFYLCVSEGMMEVKHIRCEVNVNSKAALDLDNDGDVDLLGVGSSGIYTYLNVVSSMPRVQLRLLTASDPIVIPAEGGGFEFGLECTNQLRLPIDADVYFEVEDDDTSQVINERQLTIRTFKSYQISGMTQSVPGSVAPGTYTYRVSVWDQDNWDFPLAEDSFTIIKEAAGGAPARGGRSLFDPNGWTLTGWPLVDDAALAVTTNESALPIEHQLLPAYPNPFNASATVTVALPEAERLSLAIYDVLGREVLHIADGALTAGEHRFTVPADQWPSGVYFVHASTPTWQATQKVVLLK